MLLQQQNDDLIEIAAVLIFLLAIYIIPTVIAIIRKHNNLLAIILLNLFLGWIPLVWIGVLIWSIINKAKAQVSQPVIVQNMPAQAQPIHMVTHMQPAPQQTPPPMEQNQPQTIDIKR